MQEKHENAKKETDALKVEIIEMDEKFSRP